LKTLITICARGGSKGIPGKNIKSLNGKPLIYYTIRVAKQFQETFANTNIVVSTDSQDIKRVTEDYGIICDYNRPEYLAGDSVGKIDTIKDVLLWQENRDKFKYDYILDLDVTSPLRNLTDLILAYNLIKENELAVNLFSVSPANRSPYFNMVEQKENGFFSLVKKPKDAVFTRQSAPKVYDLNASFYYYKRVFFDLGYSGAITENSLIYEVPHTCFDLDHPIDFEIVSFLMKQNKLDFEL